VASCKFRGKADFKLVAPVGATGLDPKYNGQPVECKQFGIHRGGLEEAKKAFDPKNTKPDFNVHAHTAKIFFVWVAKERRYYFLDYLNGYCEVTSSDLSVPSDLY
jgi:hypothetical protein